MNVFAGWGSVRQFQALAIKGSRVRHKAESDKQLTDNPTKDNEISLPSGSVNEKFLAQ